jgi:hypothetical protein
MVIDPWLPCVPVKQAPTERLSSMGQAIEQRPRALIEQVEFYFSPSNLNKDQFLQSKMMEGGWVDLEVIASFNRVQAFEISTKELAETLAESIRVEIREDEGPRWCIRPRLREREGSLD